MNRPIRRLAAVVFAGFGLLVAAVTWLQVIDGPRYRDDQRNARVALSRVGRERGGIVTADGVVLATSVADTADPRSFRREYPEADLYAHVVGYSSLLFGDTGLEEARASALTSGRSSTISALLTVLSGGDLRARGLRLTIDHGLQRVAAEALGRQRGAVVAIDPRTGAVLAMVSYPSFDPNELLGDAAEPVAVARQGDPDRPLLNRATSELYSPGSTFKIVTAASALEAGLASPETLFADPVALELPGSTATIRNFSRQPCNSGVDVSLAVAFARSCNTTFGDLGMQVGARRLVEQSEAFGFNGPIPFDLATAPAAIPAWETFATDLPAVAQNAIGERDVRVTPLQAALLAGAVANGGTVMSPYLVAQVFNPDGELISTHQPTEWMRAVSPATAELLTGMMERVVTAGTGSRAAVAAVRVAGKTGTAQVPGGAPHAWFAGFAPIDAAPDQRQIAVAVLVEEGGDAGESATGGRVAAPIAARVVEHWLERGT